MWFQNYSPSSNQCNALITKCIMNFMKYLQIELLFNVRRFWKSKEKKKQEM